MFWSAFKPGYCKAPWHTLGVSLSTGVPRCLIGYHWHLQLLASHRVGSLWGSQPRECVADSCMVTWDPAEPSLFLCNCRVPCYRAAVSYTLPRLRASKGSNPPVCSMHPCHLPVSSSNSWPFQRGFRWVFPPVHQKYNTLDVPSRSKENRGRFGNCDSTALCLFCVLDIVASFLVDDQLQPYF